MRVLAVALLLIASPIAAGPALTWSPVVGREPRVERPEGGPTASLYARCGERSSALETLARDLVVSAARPSPGALAFAVHTAGLAQPWPRAWIMSGDSANALSRLTHWLGPQRGVRRCGIAHRIDGLAPQTFAVIAVDALAELTPIARRPRVGAWVSVDAQLFVEASAAAVILLGPSGEPRRVPVDLSDGIVRSRVNLDEPGEWTVQVVATFPSGPEPVLEAHLFAGVEPKRAFEEPKPKLINLPDIEVLMGLLNSERREHGLPSVVRKSSLDAVARGHAAAMARTTRVAHDSGDGDPVDRVRASGTEAHVVGENVARAANATAAHHALWQSPSHRGNMLSPRFSHIGVGVVHDSDGVWVTEVFTD